MYYVYIVECADKTLYTGYTNNLDKRIKCHNDAKTGAKYTKGRGPVVLKYYEKLSTLSEALKREIKIKKLTKKQKIELINGISN